MRWTPGQQSDDIEDRRDESPGNGGLGGGGFPMRGIPVRLGLGGTLVVLALSAFFGRDFLGALTGGGADSDPTTQQGAPRPHNAQDDELVPFVSFVLDDVQKTWTDELPKQTGTSYEHAKLVLFTDGVRSGCGNAESAMGPFYCPLDRKVYIDLGFYRDLRTRFGAPGDFAQAYVLAHEIGHHVQNLLGLSDRVHHLQQSEPNEANKLSVALELQADCLAGVWAKSTDQRKLLEEHDVDEAMGAAAAVGDDRLQRQATGRVNPERWTHGSSEQRTTWFKKGFASGDVKACSTSDATAIR